MYSAQNLHQSRKFKPKLLVTFRRSALYIVYCTLYTVHCIMYTVYCTLFTVHCILYTVYCTLYTVHCILYTVYYTLYSINCILYTVYCTVHHAPIQDGSAEAESARVLALYVVRELTRTAAQVQGDMYTGYEYTPTLCQCIHLHWVSAYTYTVLVYTPTLGQCIHLHCVYVYT